MHPAHQASPYQYTPPIKIFCIIAKYSHDNSLPKIAIDIVSSAQTTDRMASTRDSKAIHRMLQFVQVSPSFTRSLAQSGNTLLWGLEYFSTFAGQNKKNTI